MRAEQHPSLAAVLQQARHRALLVAIGGDGAERQLVAEIETNATDTPARAATSASVGGADPAGALRSLANLASDPRTF